MNAIFATLLSATVWTAGAAELTAQSSLARFEQQNNPAAGSASRVMAVLGDLDGDGLRDLALYCGTGGAGTTSWIEVRSSDTGVPLLTIETPGATPARDLASVADMNGDGYPELVAGFTFAANEAGVVEVYDGRTGAVLHHQVGDTTDWKLGGSVCDAGDVDLDGVPDFAAGATEAPTTGPGGGPQGGRFRIWSGATGAVLFTFVGLGNSLTGRSCEPLGDLDGDGHPTIAVSAFGLDRVYLLEPLGDDPIRVLNGQTNSTFGWNLDSIADLDGDGCRDLVVGAQRHGAQNEGRVAVFGSNSMAQLLSVVGPTQMGFGRHFATAGDFDLDGVEDIVASGLGDFANKPAGGVLAWISGATGAVTWESTAFGQFRGFQLADDGDGDGRADLWHTASALSAVIRLGNPLDFDSGTQALHGVDDNAFGDVVTELGDLDGDGRPELAIAAPYGSLGGLGRPGLVHVYSGATLLYALAGGFAEHFGAAVCGLDDLDGDGVDEFAVGRPFAKFGQLRPGAVSIYSGASGTLLRSHFGASAGDRFGAAVARVPDSDGDGVDDYAIGAPFVTTVSGGAGAGRVTVYSGDLGSLRFTRDGTRFLGGFGASVCGIGDLDGDGDGKGDVLVGAPGEFSSLQTLFAGRVHRLSGSSGSYIGTVGGAQARMRYGSSLAVVGDVTGDGVPEYVVGAPFYAAAAIGDGYVELCDGATGNAIWSDVGSDASRLGTAVCGCGDLDNDGVVDFAAGEPRQLDGSGERVGGVRLYSGSTLVHYLSLPGDGVGDRFGGALTAVADRDGDHAPDLVVGMPGAIGVHPNYGERRLGAATLWTARSAGSVRFGAGTSGCGGDHDLTLFQPVHPGQTMELRFSGMSPSTFPVLGFGVPLPNGVPVLGFLAHVQSVMTLALPLPGGAFGEHLEPIPNDPNLVGAEVHGQLYALWLGGCAALPFDLFSSNGLTVTVR